MKGVSSSRCNVIRMLAAPPPSAPNTRFHTATDLRHACELKAAHPDATLIAGGTDVMVGLNFGF